MCSNKKTLSCIFDGNNCSVLSDTYRRSTSKSKRPQPHQKQQQHPISSTLANQIHIRFKNKNRLLTGIDENTTFTDLKLALIITYYKKRLSRSNQPEDVQLKKFQKNFDYLKKVASEDYVITESVNDVEKMIDSDQSVRNVLKRIHRESVLFHQDCNVTHAMRLKRSMLRLSPEKGTPSKKTRSKSTSKRRSTLAGRPESTEVPILDEFFLDNDENDAIEVPPTYESMSSSNDIDEQLKCFDIIIKQRKEYITLLEKYLSLSDELEADMLAKQESQIPHFTLVAPETKKGAKLSLESSESSSTDTGFGSVHDDTVSASESLSEKFSEWCISKSVPEQNKMYFQKISNFETYV